MEKKSSVDVIRRSIRAGRYYLFKKARSHSWKWLKWYPEFHISKVIILTGYFARILNWRNWKNAATQEFLERLCMYAVLYLTQQIRSLISMQSWGSLLFELLINVPDESERSSAYLSFYRQRIGADVWQPECIHGFPHDILHSTTERWKQFVSRSTRKPNKEVGSLFLRWKYVDRINNLHMNNIKLINLKGENNLYRSRIAPSLLLRWRNLQVSITNWLCPHCLVET